MIPLWELHPRKINLKNRKPLEMGMENVAQECDYIGVDFLAGK